MPTKKFPQKTKEMEWSKFGDMYILIDPQTQKTFTLDVIAFLVWIQCDGKTSLEEMTDVFSVNGNRDIVRAALSGILEKLEKAGLIKWVSRKVKKN